MPALEPQVRAAGRWLLAGGCWQVAAERTRLGWAVSWRAGGQAAPALAHRPCCWLTAGSWPAAPAAPLLRSSSPHSAKRGLFAHPPRPSSLATTGASFLRDLLAIEVRLPGSWGEGGPQPQPQACVQ